MDASGYVFVLSLLDIQATVPCEIIPRHVLKKATTEQEDSIRSLLKRFDTSPIFLPMYEYGEIAKSGSKPGHQQFEYTHLPEEEWRYWVIEFEGTNAELEELQFACSLVHPDIELGIHVFTANEVGGGYGWHPPSLQSFLNEVHAGTRHPHDLLDDEVVAIGRYYSLLKNLPAEFEHIRRAFKRFDHLRSVPRHSELTVLGLFSVVESLLTHSPKLTESADSLSHQIKTKIPLVRKRFERPLNHASLFGEIGEDRLWAKLYAFRSKIVHGEHADLTGDLQVLGDRKKVIRFLRHTVKLLLVASLNEPVLLTDLKGC